MESKNRGFILMSYTDFNGKQWTRDQLIEKIDNILDGQGITVAQISQKIKIKVTSLYNILDHMVKKQMVSKEMPTSRSKYVFRKVQECMLAKIFQPSPEEIEKKFKIIDRKKVTVDDGTSKGFGRKGVDPYGFNYLNSVYWDGAD